MRKIFTILSVSFSLIAMAQTELVFVFFKDKPNKAAFYSNPLSELTQKSLDRRTNLGIALSDQDAPIEPTYITNIQNLGFEVTDYSKWLNGVAVNATSSDIQTLSQQSYVDHVESFVRNPNGGKRKEKIDKFKKFNQENANRDVLTNFNYGNSLSQINQINLRPLHVAGFTGTGMSIAVIDTGFPYVNTGSAFKRMRDNGHVKATYNFVTKSASVYSTSVNPHGAMCLGIIGGYIDGTFVGSAPDADFYLYASEDADNEIPEEQLYWIEAAEEADRKGVDVISTSLGYTEFDDSRYDYTYADMNGGTTFISRGAQIASEKGIFVLIAAGNEGQSNWHYISAPADNAGVFTIGAVTNTGNSSGFSSFGPNSAGVIKPDASARGTDTYYAYNNSSDYGSGTSFATPLAAGGVACFLQSVSKTIPRNTLKQSLRQNASLYPNTTDQKGYGILNFYKTYQSYLGVNDVTKAQINIYPNPAKDILNISSDKPIKSVEIYDVLGRLIKTETNNNVNVSKLTKGNYIIKIKTGDQELIEKFIKE
ncbi:S8/S53 family peptidase [Epilithonimonas sp. UC225_85]|uniref:S8/S53 family peptidase n=1 Tax=Epilithonimonas sp. UC225_85 TaxID=3350167 RepID=UPI0036D2F3C1